MIVALSNSEALGALVVAYAHALGKPAHQAEGLRRLLRRAE